MHKKLREGKLEMPVVRIWELIPLIRSVDQNLKQNKRRAIVLLKHNQNSEIR